MLSREQVADWVYHNKPDNPHVHLMTTLRPLTADGFGPKRVVVISEDGQPLRMKSDKIAYRLGAGDKREFLDQQNGWLDLQNQHLALNGLQIRVDGRSYAERGIDVVPTTHIGVAAKAIQRRAEREGRDPKLERLRVFDENRAETLRRIQRRPEIVLDMIRAGESVFDERDVGKLLHRYVDDAETFPRLMARVLQSPDALRLEGESIDFATGMWAPAKYTAPELIRLEAEMARRAVHLSGSTAFTIKAPVSSRP
ncbi:MobA/MobL family protein (plasmid) [Bradyrhizobium sp. CCGUVB23]|nr:MobA/MobL family protein [Bradyrhizobium sp. CCGUVB23]MCP3468293.1 MobA/MobL family protein [Bradyrhizobium sp. CCGUVB23]